MAIFYKKICLKQLKKIPQKDQIKILKKITLLSQNPQIGKSLKGELKGLCSIRAWPYRIIYKTNLKNITIYSIAHRQSAYN